MKNQKTPQPIPIVLVSGFLGAGKTTLMRRLIRDAHARGFKIAVVVNKFGAADIDSHILKEADAELVGSISGGCACCSGQDDFLWTLMDIGERKQNRPDVILVETSGLADPVLMLDAITVARLLPLVRLGALVSVVDALNFNAVSDEALPLLIRQLQLADWIIANKIDLAWNSEERKNRDARNREIVRQLRAVNKHAAIFSAKGCEVNSDALWPRVFEDAVKPASTPDVGEAPAHRHFQTAVVPLSTPLRRAEVELLLKSSPAEIWRIKGFLKLEGESELQLLQYSGGMKKGRGDWMITPLSVPRGSSTPPTALVFIGPRLDRVKLAEQFGGKALLPMMQGKA